MFVQKLDLLPLSPLQTRALKDGPAILKRHDWLHGAAYKFRVQLAVWMLLVTVIGVPVYVTGAYRWFSDNPFTPSIAALFGAMMLGAIVNQLANAWIIRAQQLFAAKHAFPSIGWYRQFVPAARELQKHARNLAAYGASEADDETIAVIHRFLVGEEPGYTPPPLLTSAQRQELLAAQEAERLVRKTFGDNVFAWAQQLPRAAQ